MHAYFRHVLEEYNFYYLSKCKRLFIDTLVKISLLLNEYGYKHVNYTYDESTCLMLVAVCTSACYSGILLQVKTYFRLC